MKLFHYRALNSQGHYQTGDWFGESSKALYTYLQKQNLQLVTSKVVRKQPRYPFSMLSVGTQELIDFCVHMEQLEKVKMPLTESILILACSIKNHSFKAILYDIHQSITQGFLLSEACSIHSKTFDTIFVESLSIAEKTGTLSQAFSNLQRHLFWKQEQHQKLKQTLRYPMILCSILLLMMVFMVAFVIPHLQDYLEILGVKEKPLALRSLMLFVDVLQNQGSVISFSILILSLSYWTLCKISKGFLKAKQRIVFLIPGWGRLKMDLLTGNFLQTLSILLNQKLDLLLSLEKAIQAVPNPFVREKLSPVPLLIQKGSLLSSSLRETALFSFLVIRLTELGEETGNIGHLLDQTAKMQIRNTLKQIHSLLAWTEPILIIIIGIVMMWIVAATVVPLYDNLALFDL